MALVTCRHSFNVCYLVKGFLSWSIKDLQVEFATFNSIEGFFMFVCFILYHPRVFSFSFVFLVSWKYQMQNSAVLSPTIWMHIAMVIVPGGNAVRGLLKDFYVYGVTIFIILW